VWAVGCDLVTDPLLPRAHDVLISRCSIKMVDIGFRTVCSCRMLCINQARDSVQMTIPDPESNNLAPYDGHADALVLVSRHEKMKQAQLLVDSVRSAIRARSLLLAESS
jgi:hypothetical protein